MEIGKGIREEKVQIYWISILRQKNYAGISAKIELLHIMQVERFEILNRVNWKLQVVESKVWVVEEIVIDFIVQVVDVSSIHDYETKVL